MGTEWPWFKHYPEGVRRSLDYPDVTMNFYLEESARKYPSKPVTIFYGRETTYAEMAHYVDRLAAALRRMGVSKGDRVALMLPNCPHYVISYYAIIKLGAIVVQVNPMYTTKELDYLLADSGAETIILLDAFYPRLEAAERRAQMRNVIGVILGQPQAELGEGVHVFEEVVKLNNPDPAVGKDVGPDDVAVLQYTGGTTGVAKGAMLTHRNLVANALQITEWSRPMLEVGEERILTVLPLFHSYGMTCCMNVGMVVGATLILLPKFEPEEVVNTIKQYKPTLFHGVPTMYVAVNSFPNVKDYGISSIKGCMSGAAPLPVEVQREFEAITGGTLVEGYGLSEATPVTHCNPLEGTRKVGSIGVPMPDTICKVMDVETGEREMPVGEIGELVIKGPQVMKGYWNMPEETARALRDGWLYTGDIVRMDEDGFFYVVDRKKDMIIAGGFNIYPREVEEALYEHPKVLEAAVVGVPDEYRGETVKAYVVLKEGEEASAEEIIEHCRRNLAAYKVPRLVEFRDELPKTTVGKILRRVLAEEEKEKLASRG